MNEFYFVDEQGYIKIYKEIDESDMCIYYHIILFDEDEENIQSYPEPIKKITIAKFDETYYSYNEKNRFDSSNGYYTINDIESTWYWKYLFKAIENEVLE
jgi:hypothetical protein